jgi:oxygen-independent coproporphyrinogen-3 oxidase
VAGIYIHIPFCKQKCHYCNFYSSVSLKYKADFVKALVREINSRKNYLENKFVDTIYFGGGTPSILSVDDILLITSSLKHAYNIANDAEVTLEANPDDLSKDSIFDIKKYTLVNRLSIGIQSFFNDDLHYLNRVHSGKQAYNSIENAINAGFKNITIDLIYGIPTLTDKKWKENLNRFFDYQIPHLSSYSLTVEPKTALDVLIKNNKIKNIDEVQSISHFNMLLQETENRKFINYEISNFAIDGYFSKHNSNYWRGKHYLGLGPSAHSYNGISRQWNIADIKNYCTNLYPTDLIEETEFLTNNQHYNEYVLTSLRTSWGCDINYIKNEFGIKYRDYFISNIEKVIIKNRIIRKGDIFTLTNKGKLFADGIASALFYDL